MSALAQAFLGDGSPPSNWVAQIDTGNACPADQLATHPTCQVITSAQYNAYRAKVRAPLDTMTTAQNKIAAGLTLTCSTTPSLSGTYAITPTLLTTLNTIVGWYIASGNSFPAAASQISVQDTAKALHTFPSIAAFTAFYNAVAVYWLELIDWQQRTLAGQTPALPAAASTAC